MRRKVDRVEMVNPAVLYRAKRKEQTCWTYNDAPVCTNGQTDVTCIGERYRGCPVGATDCGDNDGNPDDACCLGLGPGPGDNIDHADCRTNDADWGGTCFWGFDGIPGCCGEGDYFASCQSVAYDCIPWYDPSA